jgi:predicted nucleic acid-binding protein
MVREFAGTPLEDLVFGPEVLVADTNVVFLDACAMLTSGRASDLLRSIDLGAVVGVITEQTFWELGWNSAPVARAHKIDHDGLRAVVTTEYLSRFPVVAGIPRDSEHWMPTADEVTDPDDVPHAQLAKLISASAVYSHDRHLRRPGLAPATRDDYDVRIANLSMVSDRRASEWAASIGINLVGTGTTAAVTWGASRLNANPRLLWGGLAVVSAAAAWYALASPERRRAIAAGVMPALTQLSEQVDRGNAAQRSLRDLRLVAVTDAERLETGVASYLVRNPGATMRDLSDALALASAERRDLSQLLRTHPAFERLGRHGWSVGRHRTELSTQPSQSWRPVTEHGQG